MAGGTVVNSLLGLVFYVLVARFLSVSGFGYFSFLLGLGLLAAEIGDLGMSSSLVRFSAKDKFSGVFTLAVLERLVIGTIVIGGFAFFGLAYAGLIGCGLLLASLTSQSLISSQKYVRQILANIAGNLVRLVMVFFLVRQSQLTPVSTAVVFSFGTLITFLFAADFARLFSLSAARILWPEVVAFSRNVALSFGVASLGAKIDMPILYWLAGPVAAGLYSSAARLVSVTAQVAAAVEAVYAPKLAASPTGQKHFRDYLLLAGALAVGVLVIIPVCPFLVPVIFGPKYVPSITVLQILLVSSAVFFLAGPFSTVILYRFGKSSYHFVGSLVNLAVLLILYFLLVPAFGATGAALTSLIGNIVLLVVLFLLAQKLEHA